MQAQDIAQRLAGRLAADRGQPAAHLIVEDVWLAVVDGSLGTGQRLPTARQLAIALGISPRSVERAYQALERLGVLATRPGAGTFVSVTPPPEAERERHREFAALCRDTVQRARELGFSVDDVIDAVAEFRTADPAPTLKD